MEKIHKNVLVRSVIISMAAVLCLLAQILVFNLAGNAEKGGLLLILFVTSPLISLIAGGAIALVRGNVWIGLAAMVAAHLVIVFSLFNSSALVYVPVYLLLFLTGYILPAFVRRFFPAKRFS